MAPRKSDSSPGQAIVEFALILVILLLVFVVLLESARILFGWVTLQNAVREGARYAITGNVDLNCPPPDLPTLDCSDLRLAAVKGTVHRQMQALRLNEDTGRLYEDDYYYLIEVFGVDQNGQLIPDYAGAPGQPVVVRATYRVPIVTPLLNYIVPSLAIFGQTTMNNELFGQQGNVNQGSSLPPVVPPVPTPGVTPSPTPSPSPSATASPGPDPTETSTTTATATPLCGLFIDAPLVRGNTFVPVTGDVGVDVQVIDQNTGALLGTGTLPAWSSGSHVCTGFLQVPVSQPLVAGHVIIASPLGTGHAVASRIVLDGTPTLTPSPTFTPIPTATATNTPTPTPTNTPTGPQLELNPNCAQANSSLQIVGYNWPTASSISLFWDDSLLIVSFPPGHSGSFNLNWQITFNPPAGAHAIYAYSGSTLRQTRPVTVPCPGLTPTPVTATPTATPQPPDLVIVSPPQLISTPPIVEYRPIQVRVQITNAGQTDINSQFFVDLFLDPTTVLTSSIPLNLSSGYMAVSSLAAGASRTLTITADLGFTGGMRVTRTAYGMVDSLRTVVETNETNNLTNPPLYVANVTPGPSPTPSPTPGGSDVLAGTVSILGSDGSYVPQNRADVYLRDNATGLVVQQVRTLADGSYTFSGVAPGVYTVTACFSVDGRAFVGLRTGVTPPYWFVDIFMAPDPAGCP